VSEFVTKCDRTIPDDEQRRLLARVYKLILECGRDYRDAASDNGTAIDDTVQIKENESKESQIEESEK